MECTQAATLLGVPVDADRRTITRAWRMWARLAHPDVGGDAAHFAELELARRVLLAQRPLTPLDPLPRVRLREVVLRPTHPVWLVVTATACIVLSLAGLVVPPLLGALIASSAAAMWAWWASRTILGPRADRGHRIAVIALVWLPLWMLQVLVSTVAGASLLPVLPITALPLAIAVASVNPGAGLWQPARR